MAGFVISLLYRLPVKGDQIVFEDWQLKVADIQ
nr:MULTISPECIES: transporter associated domain-containing protein [Pseudomonas]